MKNGKTNSDPPSRPPPLVLTVIMGVVVGGVVIVHREPVDGGVDGFLELVVGTFRVKIHGPGEVHECQVSLTEFFVHLKNKNSAGVIFTCILVYVV